MSDEQITHIVDKLREMANDFEARHISNKISALVAAQEIKDHIRRRLDDKVDIREHVHKNTQFASMLEVDFAQISIIHSTSFQHMKRRNSSDLAHCIDYDSYAQLMDTLIDQSSIPGHRVHRRLAMIINWSANAIR